MALDTTYGNISDAQAARLAWAVGQVDEVEHEPGSTEPWISRLVGDFIVASGALTVLETGCFKGSTSVYIAQALDSLGGGIFHMCEIDKGRMAAAMARTKQWDKTVERHVHLGDVLAYLTLNPRKDRFDVAWVDDNHDQFHVLHELTLLYPLMNPGGLILLHDVYGRCDLQKVVRGFGGYSIDLPRLGPAGGLGIIQVPG